MDMDAGRKKRQGRPPAVRGNRIPNYFLFTAFFSSAPGVNFATLRAAILMVAPVCGLRPLRAFLCETEKVPKPINATRSPLRRAAVTLSTAVSMAVVACALLISHAPAILSTRSALFIVFPRRSHSCPAETGTAFGVRAELGNLTARIVLSLSRLSTVKIRVGSLFRTSFAPVRPSEAACGSAGTIFPSPPQNAPIVHRMYTDDQGFLLARRVGSSAKSKEKEIS